MINLKDFFSNIINLDYAIVKFDTPYMPKDFPNSYPVGKDLDLFVNINDFKLLINITNKFINKYKNIFDIRIISNKNNIRFRLENKNKLHYQIDITIDNENFLENKILINNIFYILSIENETKIRKKEYQKNPNKIHHLEWLKKNYK